MSQQAFLRKAGGFAQFAFCYKSCQTKTIKSQAISRFIKMRLEIISSGAKSNEFV
jgi:hypothetical protein